MDCDFSHSPRYVPQFLEHIQNYDVVVGSRYVQGGKTDERWRWGRWLLSWWANSVYTRLILGCDVQDVTAGFKCWRAETLRGIDLSRIRSQGYVFQVEMAYVTERLGYRVLEIPIYFEDRRVGQSKMTMPYDPQSTARSGHSHPAALVAPASVCTGGPGAEDAAAGRQPLFVRTVPGGSH
jgi:dolichol-phosphate mannosyltransferase